MKKAVLLILLFTFKLHAQQHFEAGYVIDNKGNKSECLINNEDWRFNPEKFSYKMSETDIVKEGNLSEVSEFGINNKFLFKRFTVFIDKTLNDINKINETSKAVNIEETLFLKQVISSKTSLYKYESLNLLRFFYQESTNSPQQLLYKKYYNSQMELKENNLFKKQLFDLFKSVGMKKEQFDHLKYSENEISKLFIEFNQLSNNQIVEINKPNAKTKFKYGISAGLRYQALSISNVHETFDNNTIVFDKKMVPNVGVEFVLLLPYNNGRWEFSVNPSYLQYKSLKQWDYVDTGSIVHSQNVEADLKLIQLPFTLKYNYLINNNNKLYVSAGLMYTHDLNSKIFGFPNGEQIDIDIIQQFDAKFGVGYEFSNFALDVNYYLGNSLKTDVISWKSDYNNFGFRLVYFFINEK